MIHYFENPMITTVFYADDLSGKVVHEYENKGAETYEVHTYFGFAYWEAGWGV